jgi:hypothetical protein
MSKAKKLVENIFENSKYSHLYKKDSNINTKTQNFHSNSKKLSKWNVVSECFVSKIMKSLNEHTYNPNLYGLMDTEKDKKIDK